MKKLFCIPVVMAMLALAMTGDALSAGQECEITLRVLILDDRDSVNLALKGKYKIYPINSDAVVMEGPCLAANVTAANAGIRIGKSQLVLPAVKVKVARDSNIYVDSRRFRGDIDIIRKDNGKLMVVNYIGLEDYLYGVLYHEVSHRWPAEVLKAQAIAARTFALYQARQNRLQPYDLRSDIYSQVYGGRTSEKWSTTRAVNLTKGGVLAYNGNIIPAYYHAACAGHTEDASNLWNIDAPYLKGVQCGWCKDSKHYRWRKEISLRELADKLKSGGYKIGKIASVAVLSKNRSDRVDKIEIKDDAGISVVLTGKDFRQLIGPNEVRSTKFDASVKLNSLVLEGMGWGHGAGMCQWGAYGQARKGKKAEEILKFYYPGTEISDTTCEVNR
ncbi:MAG: SpoIID/LytB domain-containing protein [Candidatus Omnitrophota bacterium]